MAKQCWQETVGLTACFEKAGSRVCSLNFCPVDEMKMRRPELKTTDLLHTHCVRSAFYNQQSDFKAGKGEYDREVAKLKKQQKG